MSVNLSKCKEIVFRRPSVKLDILPDPLADIECVSCAKLLGIFIECRLKFTDHVDYVIKILNQRLYLLQQLHKQSLSDKCLDVVFCNPVGRFVYLFSSAQQQEYLYCTKILNGTFMMVYAITGTNP